MLHYIILQGQYKPHHVVETRNDVYPSILNIYFHQSNAILQLFIYLFIIYKSPPMATTIMKILEFLVDD